MGLIANTGVNNHHARTGWLVRVATDKAHAIANLAMRDDLALDALAYSMRVDATELASRCYKPVRISPTLPGVDFHGATVPLYDLVLGHRRQAVSWLKGEWYHRAIGHHGLVTHCPKTGERLVDQCSACKTILRWSDPDPRQCQVCGVDLRRGQDDVLDTDTLKAVRPMLALVDPDPSSRCGASPLPPAIERLGRGAAFELGWRIGCIGTGHGLGDRDRAKAMPVETRLEILKAGSEALAHWPHSLHSALSERVGEAGGAAAKALAAELRAIARADNAWPEVRDAVIEAMPSLSKSLAAAVKETLPGGANAAEAQTSIGIGQKLFQRIRNTRHLAPVIKGGVVNRFDIFADEVITPVRDAIGDRIGLGSARRRLGTSRHGVEQLCCLNLCELLQTDIIMSVFDEPQVRRSGLESLISRLRDASLTDEPEDGISLRDAMSRIGGREKPWGPVFAAMLDGSLPFFLNDEHSGRLTTDIMIAAPTGAIVEAFRFERSDYPDFKFEDVLIREDVEELLNANPTTLQRALDGKEIDISTSTGFDPADVRALASSLISAREVAARWGVSGRKLPKRACLSRAARKGQLGWCRQTVEDAMQEATPTLH